MLTQAFFSLLWREHSFKLSYGFTDFWFIRGIVEECPTKDQTAVFQYSYCEVAVLIPSVCRAAEGGLKSKTIYQIEFSPHHNSRCRLSRLLYLKVAALETEVLCIFTK